MKLKIKEGTTSKLIRIFAQDSTATDGSGKTGIAYNASGLTAYYLPEGDATATQITLASGTTGTYSSGGWSEVDSTNLPGVYEVGLPDACVDATSEGTVLIMFKGATDMAPVLCELELDSVNYRDATAFGLSRLDAAVSTRSTVTITAIADAVWDESLSGHTTSGSTGKAIKQLKEGIIGADGSVNDASATSTTFITNLSSATDGFFHDMIIVFISGSLAGQARHIETYTGSTKSVTVSQAFTSAPANADEFLIIAGHEHSLNEIADAVWNEQQSGHTTSGSFGYYVDARISQVATGGSSPWDALLTDYVTAGTFGARFQEGARYQNTDANIIYIRQNDSYDDTANPAITWNVTKDYAAWTGTLTIRHRLSNATILSATVTRETATRLKAILTTADTAFADLTTADDFGPHPYEIQMTSGSSAETAIDGAAVLTQDR